MFLRAVTRKAAKPVSLGCLVVMLAMLLPVSHAWSADPAIKCVQEILNDAGFNAGPEDGVLGKKTSAAFSAYREFMKPRYGMQGDPLDYANGSDWCEELSERHPLESATGLAFRNIIPYPGYEIWQRDFKNGWAVRILNWNPEMSPDDVVLFAHGDELDHSLFPYICQEVKWKLRKGTVLACVFRPYATVPRKRRQPEEVAEFSELVRALTGIWPAASLHCGGNSSGGHLCLTLAQQPDIQLGCVVASAPPAALRMTYEISGHTLRRLDRRAYDPIDHVEKTRGERIMIVGDQRDDVVSYKVWDAFIAAAAEHGIDVEFERVFGRGHDVRNIGAAHMRVCLKDLERR